jgi:hypothetical protein
MQVADTGERQGQEAQLGKHAGPLIWSLVFVMCAGFSLGGVAIIFKSLLWFIVGAAIFIVAAIASLFAGIMQTTE